MSTQEPKKSFKDTLNLPQTDFSIRANAAEKEPALRTQWQEHGIVSDFFSGQADYVLHDGPPYANGNIHMGHALNKVLKDIMVRVARMQGKKVAFRPGWDCHGLPIELKVAAADKENSRATDPAGFKKQCREYAFGWHKTQEEQFKQLGVFSQWEKPYLTMAPEYEADILRSLATFVEKGHIERKGKTVPWCFNCQTVLANAEIEYADRKDPSCYILFEVADKSFVSGWQQKAGAPAHLPSHGTPEQQELSLSFLIWTTTPWTIPLNRAVVLHPDAQYAVVQLDDQRAMIVGAELVEKLRDVMDRELPVLQTMHSSELVGLRAQHPLVDTLTVPVISDNEVSTKDGTACLHSAPGCGPEDYLMGIKNGLEIYSPLSSDGKYTDEILPAALNGMPITDGQWWVLGQLKESGALLHKTSLKHSFPHCWRCQNGLMFRATDQWFCNLSHNDLIKKAQEKLDEVTFIPSWGKNRLEAFLENRTEWCISRQRTWGVPIPALFNQDDESVHMSADFVRAIADRVAVHGIEYWDTATVADLRRDGMLPDELAALSDDKIRKETDILDVWFDSGVSHSAVIKAQGDELPVDMYLEGSDQHRGWFQSSWLSSMVMHGRPPMKAITTHGFVVDEKGHKMSKSRGNVVDPLEVIKKYGADVLRLWVASVDYERDMSISPKMLDQVAGNYRKLRNTCRFLLSNLYDFDPQTHLVAVEDMRLIDRQAVAHAGVVSEQVKALYQDHAYAQVVQTLVRYCTVELSSQYLDISKDRLYVEAADSVARRSAQTAQHYILMTLNRLLAPLCVYMADDVFAHVPYGKELASVHLATFAQLPSADAGSDELWQSLYSLREQILHAIERERESGAIKHSLEAAVTVQLPDAIDADQLQQLLGEQSIEAFLKEWCVVSKVTIADGGTVVTHAPGVKCPRCWHWQESNNADGLCHRCEGRV